MLLRTRLLSVALIFFVAGIVFLVRDLLDQSSVVPVVETALVAGLGIAAGLLWSGRFCTLTQLRLVELAMFGSVSAYLAAQDYRLVYSEVIQGNGDSEKACHSVRRFERETQATASRRSPPTVELYDFGVTNEGVF